jgi:dihydroorotase
MPNLKPVPDSEEHIREQLTIIERDSVIEIYPYASITKSQAGEELSDMEALSPLSVAFSDDGRGVQREDIMRAAMLKAKALGKMIVAHCEDNSLLRGGYIHDGEYAKAHGHRGICSESEWGPIKRDIELVREIGCKYHVCHISTKESVELIRKAKADGVDISCETAPHYLILDDSCLKEDGRFKMNPPLRSKEDKEALIAGLIDGTIDMIATDHAPHSKEDKGAGLSGSAFGVVGLEFAFPAMYTHFVRTGIITLERLEELMAIAPRERFGLPIPTDSYSVWDLNEEFTVNPDDFLSLGKATPFEGHRLFGVNKLTCHRGKTVYKVN